MLNKKICKKCFKENNMKWGKQTVESLWNKHILLCPNKFWPKDRFSLTPVEFSKAILINTVGEPPKWCPYILEHVVSDQDAR